MTRREPDRSIRISDGHLDKTVQDLAAGWNGFAVFVQSAANCSFLRDGAKWLWTMWPDMGKLPAMYVYLLDNVAEACG
jgi:hypothetical protein